MKNVDQLVPAIVTLRYQFNKLPHMAFDAARVNNKLRIKFERELRLRISYVKACWEFINGIIVENTLMTEKLMAKLVKFTWKIFFHESFFVAHSSLCKENFYFCVDIFNAIKLWHRQKDVWEQQQRFYLKYLSMINRDIIQFVICRVTGIDRSSKKNVGICKEQTSTELLLC